MLKISPKSDSELGNILHFPKIPGSKYEAVRLLILAALAKGETTLQGLPDAQDIKDTLTALRHLGIAIKTKGDTAIIQGSGGNFTPKKKRIYLGKSGTLARFIIPFVALQKKTVYLDADAQLCSRPMQEIFAALIASGVQIDSEHGHLPATICGGTLQYKKITVDTSRSSQFLSGLLLIAPIAHLQVATRGKTVSQSFIDLTLDLMTKFGATCHQEADTYYCSATGYRAQTYQIPADWSSTSYFLALSAITGVPGKIGNLDFQSKQGEARFYHILKRMGCQIKITDNYLTVQNSAPLQGATFDMNQMPDIVPTLAVIATMATGKTVISNIAHLRYKECDRLNLIVSEINRIGGKAEVRGDKMIIYPQKPTGGTIDPHDDHRLAMSFALLGLAGIPLNIKNPQCVNKSFPTFWELTNQTKPKT